jgi:glycosyltransferase involved in cell wall biosynthesis
MEQPLGSFAFVKIGDFSSANERIFEQLRRQFPDLAADVIDVRDLNVASRSDAARLLFAVAREYGPAACLTRGRFFNRVLRTGYSFRKIRARLLQRLLRRPYVFTFQTQSLFDASVPGTPHFVYTDHTHLANLFYSAEARPPLASRTWRELERSIYNNARINFTMSRHVARSLTEHYGCREAQIECVYAGSNVPMADLQELGSARFSHKRILFVGIDWERKGGPVLLEAFRRVRQSHPTAELVIVGCSPEISMPGCRVVGRVPLADVAAFYRSASVFCLPTTVEPFGFVFIEAFAHGLPVVATDIGAIPDFVEEGRSGHRVGCGDSAQLADRLSELLADPARCAAFGARGQALVRDRYTWQATAEKLAGHIRRCVALDVRPVEVAPPLPAPEPALVPRVAL